MKLIKGEFKEELELQLAPSIKAGFPSPAEDYLSESLDFNRDLIKHPEATFYAVVDGDSMTGLGINPGDIAVIDKSLEPAHGDIIASYINGEFNIKQLDLNHQKDGCNTGSTTSCDSSPPPVPQSPSFRQLQRCWIVFSFRVCSISGLVSS